MAATAATKYADIFAALTREFHGDDVKKRSGGGGRQLSYITARTAMNRLDEVLGPEGWEDEYYEVCGVLFCRLTITLPDGRKITKSDAGGFKEMTEGRGADAKIDQENTDKTGSSDAFKRACAKFGIGRYLYRDGMIGYDPQAQAQDQTQAEPKPKPERKPESQTPPATRPANLDRPANSHQLVAWAEESAKVANKWWKDAGNPGKLVENHWQLIRALGRAAADAGAIGPVAGLQPKAITEMLCEVSWRKLEATTKKYLYTDKPAEIAVAATRTQGQLQGAHREPGSDG